MPGFYQLNLTSGRPVRSKPLRAQVAELVDALASGASGLTAVKVRVLSWAPFLVFTPHLKTESRASDMSRAPIARCEPHSQIWQPARSSRKPESGRSRRRTR